jgi:hypothetical protein
VCFAKLSFSFLDIMQNKAIERIVNRRYDFLVQNDFKDYDDKKWDDDKEKLYNTIKEVLRAVRVGDDVLRCENSKMRLWETDKIRAVKHGIKNDNQDVWLMCFKKSDQVTRFLVSKQEPPFVIPLRLTDQNKEWIEKLLVVLYNDQEPFLIS